MFQIKIQDKEECWLLFHAHMGGYNDFFKQETYSSREIE